MKGLLNREKASQLKLLVFGSILSFIILGFRIAYADSTHFLFLVWNLFLAFIPFAISSFLTRDKKPKKLGLITGAWLLVWLVFFPNAPYILTDLVHLKHYSVMPLWFDLGLILSFAFTGLLFAFYSLRDIEKLISQKWGYRFGRLASAFILFLSAYGIYIGRYLRWNTWDIIANPLGLASQLSQELLHPLSHPRPLGMTAIFGTLLLLVYMAFKELRRQEANPQ